MDISGIRKHWYANIYDKHHETQTDEIDCLLKIIGSDQKNILEVCCGTGRILAPIAKNGHYITGFDIDEYMLERIPEKITGLDNVRYYKADALNVDWGNDFDVVILAANIMMNIITDGNYEDAQRLFIQKAGRAIKQDGHIYLDFNHFNLDSIGTWTLAEEDRVIFEDYDEKKVYGKFIYCKGDSYDEKTQMNYGKRRIELILPDGRNEIYEYPVNKRIPTLNDVKRWLDENNFEIEFEYGNYKEEPISGTTDRAIIYAKKVN